MTKPPPMPEPPMPTYEALWAKEAAYWLAHAKELAAKYRDAPGLTAVFGRMRARQAVRFYGRCLAMLETSRLWL